ncbi:hypothetical protein AB0L05_40055 [Nonomuraea pusilla]|uniref:hypothetical protein n=1 Tax=Nonomuraea pusilla TaxID=46177 RepID=UPI0033170A6B
MNVEQDSTQWPPSQGPILGPIIKALIAALAPACHARHSTIGKFIDHGPTGLLIACL